jgi:hypothetical protein
MPRTKSCIWLAVCAVSALCWPAHGQNLSFNPEIGLELRTFAQEGQFPGQLNDIQPSLLLSGKGRWESENGSTRILFEPLLRLDGQDSERTQFDLREASLQIQKDDWSILVGVSQVTWGVVETRKIVDVINQIDSIEDVDEGEKLGQPMVRVSRRFEGGSLEAYYLPFFRRREFPGIEGRLRTQPVTDAGRSTYERSGEEWAGDFALRLKQNVDKWDIGASAFYGTSREPILSFDPVSSTLIPTYPALKQIGVDIQYTSGPWLWKLEAVTGAYSQSERFIATVAGLEYTFFDIAGRGIDLGIVTEYLRDDRDQRLSPATLFQDDIFLGLRMTLNDTADTEFLAGVISDTKNGADQFSAEFQRRIGQSLLLEIEARAFDVGTDALLQSIKRDGNVTFRFKYFF